MARQRREKSFRERTSVTSSTIQLTVVKLFPCLWSPRSEPPVNPINSFPCSATHIKRGKWCVQILQYSSILRVPPQHSHQATTPRAYSLFLAFFFFLCDVEEENSKNIIKTELIFPLQSTRFWSRGSCMTTVSPITQSICTLLIAETKQVVWAEGEEKNITQEVVCSSNH